MNRYFEIIKQDSRRPLEFVEYFGDFAIWSYRQKVYRWEYYDKKNRIMWFIGSDLVVDYHHVVRDLLNRKEDAWKSVDLAIASNPKSQRQPAMKKRAKK